MTTAGILRVSARVDAAHRPCELAVHLQRPPVTRLFLGQPPEAVVKTVPYLYSLCAQAQRTAAQAALAAATRGERRPAEARDLWLEFLHENFWRLLLDWPAALGLPPANEAFVAWRGARPTAEATAASQQLLADTLLPLAKKCREILVDRGIFRDAGFAPLNAPDWLDYWQGQRADMPPTARPHSVGAAYAQRVADVERAVAALADRADYPVAAAGGDGWGVGQTLTARGVLTHAVHVAGDHVHNYRVWAPTDCHFADAEGIKALLADCAPADDDGARRCIEQAVLALDPCLPFTVELSHA